MSMIVHPPERKVADGRAVVSARIELLRTRGNLPERIWFALDEQDAGFVDGSSNGIATVLLPVAMALGEDLEIRGILCPRLALGLEEYQRVMLAWLPGQLRQVSLRYGHADAEARVGSEAVGTAFSGGVDSFHTLKTHLGDAEPRREHRISHALFVHGFDIPLDEEDSYAQAARAYRAFLQSVDVRLVCLRTNLRDFTKSPGWEMAHGAALIGSALILGRLFRRFFVPSSRSYETLIPWGSHPLLDPLLSTDTLQVIHDATHLTRVDKIRVLAAWPPTYSLLRTCYAKRDGLNNCCRCDNCIRTMTAFEVFGALHKYSTFPLPLERRHIRRGPVLTRHERACARQIIALAWANHRHDLAFDQGCALLLGPLLALVRYGEKVLSIGSRLLANRDGIEEGFTPRGRFGQVRWLRQRISRILGGH